MDIPATRIEHGMWCRSDYATHRLGGNYEYLASCYIR